MEQKDSLELQQIPKLKRKEEKTLGSPTEGEIKEMFRTTLRGPVGDYLVNLAKRKRSDFKTEENLLAEKVAGKLRKWKKEVRAFERSPDKFPTGLSVRLDSYRKTKGMLDTGPTGSIEGFKTNFFGEENTSSSLSWAYEWTVTNLALAYLGLLVCQGADNQIANQGESVFQAEYKGIPAALDKLSDESVKIRKLSVTESLRESRKYTGVMLRKIHKRMSGVAFGSPYQEEEVERSLVIGDSNHFPTLEAVEDYEKVKT